MSRISVMDSKGNITCPRCESTKNLLAYTKLGQEGEEKWDTIAVIKCPECRFVFAPNPV